MTQCSVRGTTPVGGIYTHTSRGTHPDEKIEIGSLLALSASQPESDGSRFIGSRSEADDESRLRLSYISHFERAFVSSLIVRIEGLRYYVIEVPAFFDNESKAVMLFVWCIVYYKPFFTRERYYV